MKALFDYVNSVFDLFLFGGTFAMRYLFIVIMSSLSAVMFLVVFKQTSNQQKLQYEKNKIVGYLLQMRLYRDRFFLLIQCVLAVLKHNVLYLQHTLVPLLILCIPLIIITFQVNARGGYLPLSVQENFIVRADLDDKIPIGDESQLMEKIYCTASPEIRVETLPLRVTRERKVFWRARVVALSENGRATLQIGIQGGDAIVERSVVIGPVAGGFQPLKAKYSFWNGWDHGVEGFIPDSAKIQAISIGYRRAGYPFLFWKLDAVVLYFVLTMLLGIALKKPLGVAI
jgi:hypothetical protein